MQIKKVPLSEFREGMRKEAFDAIDGYVRRFMETEMIDGWKDSELPALSKSIDAHADAVAERINAGHEPNSAHIGVDLDK